MAGCSNQEFSLASINGMWMLIAKRKKERRQQLLEKLRRERETMRPPRAVTSLKMVLPTEMWHMVFGYLNEPRDLQSVEMFGESFETSKSLALLPEVLSILKERNYIKRQDIIWTIRLVSKWFKWSFDWAFYERRFLTEDWHLKWAPKGEEYEKGVLQLLAAPRLNGTSWIPPLQGSHIWCRSVKLEIRNADLQGIRGESEDKEIDTFFERFGSSIWSLNLDATWARRDSKAEFYKALCRWASHLPNLKVLMITCMIDWSTSTHNSIIRFEGHLGWMELKELKETPPFPCIPSLRVYISNTLPFTQFSEKILASNPGVRVVSPFTWDVGEESTSFFTQLRIEGLDKGRSFYSTLYGMPFHKTYLSKGCQWPLKRVNLCVTGDSPMDLINFLTTFKSTLEYVTLQMSESDSPVPRFRFGLGVGTSRNMVLDLPKVKELRLRNYETFFPFSVIYTMGQLEKLELSMTKHVRDSPELEYVDFYKRVSEGRVGESTIWDVFANLIKIDYKVTLMEYDKLLKKEVFNKRSEFVFTRKNNRPEFYDVFLRGERRLMPLIPVAVMKQTSWWRG